MVAKEHKRITRLSMFFWIKKHIGVQFLLAILIIATIFFRVFPLEMQKRIINYAIGMKSIHRLFTYCALYFVAVVVAGVLKLVINIIQNYIGQRILYQIRAALYDHIIQLPLNFFRKTPPGMVISSLTSELTVVGEFLGSAISTPLVNILTLLTFAGYMIYLNPLLALVSFSIYPIEVLIIPFLQKKYNRLNKTRIDITRRLSNLIGEVVSGIHEVHGNASYRLETNRFNSVAKSLFKIRHRMNTTKFFIKFTNNFFQNMGPFTLFILGGYLSIKGRLDLGALVAFLSAYEKLYDPWKELMDYYQTYQEASVRYKRVMQYFDYEPAFKKEPENRESYVLNGSMELDSVSFMVDGHPILDGVSLTTPSNNQIAIVGFSGSGKSTLIMILAQMYDYHSGHVKIDGFELKSLTKLDIASNVGYVAQFPFIFSGTIRDNLLYACRALESNVKNEDGAVIKVPSEEEIVSVIENIGLDRDLILFGLNSHLDPETELELSEKILKLRRLFRAIQDDNIVQLVESFEEDSYLEYCSLATNMVFGFHRSGKSNEEVFPSLPGISDALSNLGLETPLLVLGKHIVSRSLEILEDVKEDEFFFRTTPLSSEEMEHCRGILKNIDNLDNLKWDIKWVFIKIALRYTPKVHPIVNLPDQFKSYVVRCRKALRSFIEKHYPDEFTFIDVNKYLSVYTIFRNIIFGTIKSEHPRAEDMVREAVIKLIKEHGTEDSLILKGLDFDVGSKGDRLSGGQKQKLAIARTLLKKPNILILDEATASLDNVSQQRVQRLISEELKGKCTVLSVVHRLEMVKDYDQIIVMKSGRIIEQGSFDELMSKKGAFYELYHGF